MQVAASAALIAPKAPRVSGTQSLTASAAIDAFNANPRGKVEVNDTAANISSNFDALSRMGTSLTKINVSDADATHRVTVSAAQFANGTKTLASIKTSGYELKVTNVTMDQLNSIAGNAKVKSVEVTDSSANIGAKFASMLNQPNKISKITQTGTASDIQMSGDMFSRSTTQTLLTKVQGSYALALNDVRVADLASATGNIKVSSVAVKDTSANISVNLAGQTPSLVGDKVSSIIQSDVSNSISITDTKFQALTSTLAKLAGASSLAVTGVTAARGATVAANASVKSVSVTDTAANIYNNRVANAAATKISTVNLEDTGASFSASLTNILGNTPALNSITKIKLTDTANISITGAQLKNNAAMALLGKVYGSNNVKGNYNLTATSVLAADVSTAARLTTVNKIRVNDSVSSALSNLTALNSSKVDKIDLTGGTGAQLGGANLDKLDALGAKLNSVSSNGANIGISYDQYVKRSATLAKIDSGKLVVSEAGASATKKLNDDAGVDSFTVKDSAAKMAANFADLKAAVTSAKLTQAKLTDNGAISLTATQYGGANDLLDVVKDSAGGGNFKLELSEATASGLVALYTSSNHYDNVTKVSIQDTSANISAKLADLGAAFAASTLGDITLTGSPADIAITKGQLDDTNISGALGKITGQNYTLDVSGVSAAGASALISNAKVAKLSVEDTSAHITSKLADLAAITPSKLTAISVTDHASAEITIASSLLPSYSGILGKMDDYQLNVTDVSASAAKLLTDTNTKVSHLTVKDTGTSITAKLADLNTLTDSGMLTDIAFDNPANNALILTNTQYNDGAVSALTILNGGDYALSISGVAVADAVDVAKNVNADAHVSSYSVKDLGANIETNLQDLEARGGKIQSINWTDTVDGAGAATSLNITGQDYHDFIGTLSKINGGEYNAHVTLLSAADTVAAESDANITQFSVKDTAANLGANLAALQASAGAGTPKIQLIEQDGAGDVAMTATDYTASTDARAMMTTSNITMTVSDVAAADVATVIGDAQVQSISVSGTASDLVAKLGDGNTAGDLDTNAAKITAITVSDDGVLALTGAQYADNVASGGILDKLSQNTGGYHATIAGLAGNKVADATGDSNVDSFAVTDDAAGLTANFADLVAANVDSKLTSVTNSDAGTVSIPLSDLVAHAVNYANTLNKFDAPPAVTLT
jgi:hypothetical protein